MKFWMAILMLVATILIVGTMAFTGTKLAQPKKTTTYVGQSIMKMKHQLESTKVRTR